MSADPRAALNQLVAAFERHLEASSTRHGDDDPTVVAAYEDLADAFEAYDGALYDAYGEMTPLDIYTDEGDGDEGDGTEDTEALDDHDDEDGDGTQLYSGLDDDIDFDEDDDEESEDSDGDDEGDEGDDTDPDDR
ncbi:hypothetical protein GCM10023168_18270 [Fodinibacter luteus]|uniref:Primosomal protein n=1 Tax=Fodinibacter luteus TaxID=552064 RepID=A0ABP8KEJ8_9MICO